MPIRFAMQQPGAIHSSIDQGVDRKTLKTIKLRFLKVNNALRKRLHYVLLGMAQGTTMLKAYFSVGIMSTATMERLRSEALTLSEPELAELAHDLIKSLDVPTDEGVEEAWDQEIVRRIAQIDSGQAKLLNR